MNGPFSGVFENDSEICKSNEGVIRVLVTVSDLFQNGAENGIFGHPTRNSFDLVAPSCRFLYDDTLRRDHSGWNASAAESFLAKSGCAISKYVREKGPEKGSLLRVTFWFQTFNLPSSGSQLLKSPIIIPSAPG